MLLRHRYRAALIVLIAGTLACSTITNLADQGQSAAATAQSFATQGSEFVSTAEAAATELEASGFAETAEALATELESGGLATTAEALGTQADATAEAVATAGSISLGEAPADIPVMEGEKDLFFGSEEVVSYFIKVDYDEVLAFYKQEMPAHDWRLIEGQSVESEGSAVLTYEKPDKTAMVTLSHDAAVGSTIVQVTIQKK